MVMDYIYGCRGQERGGVREREEREEELELEKEREER